MILYALLAVLLWPTGSEQSGADTFVAAQTVGATAARLLWLVLWGSLAYFAVLRANRAPQGLHDMIAQMASGQPRWLTTILNHSATVVAHRGLDASIALAVILAVVAAGIFLPAPAARAVLVLALLALSGDLAGRRSIGRHAHRPGHRPQLRTAAGTAGRRLLAPPSRATSARYGRGLTTSSPFTSRKDGNTMGPAWLTDSFAVIMLVVASTAPDAWQWRHYAVGRSNRTSTQHISQWASPWPRAGSS
ncbi:hypothetical protein NGB36_01900 [Streptomyces sp. RB6PN25]|uniref:Uncharacterized protein n=1 Tax=Streptomyces humicola TaxID=2953240 RepID=A0ABT1PR10_9ACTN|nr:hypothetical protein [Streptomyces humicola]MCQ4079390.1 hypothetical protein [Streptomyces humicola]